MRPQPIALLHTPPMHVNASGATVLASFPVGSAVPKQPPRSGPLSAAWRSPWERGRSVTGEQKNPILSPTAWHRVQPWVPGPRETTLIPLWLSSLGASELCSPRAISGRGPRLHKLAILHFRSKLLGRTQKLPTTVVYCEPIAAFKWRSVLSASLLCGASRHHLSCCYHSRYQAYR